MKKVQLDNGDKKRVVVRGKTYEVPEYKGDYKLPLFERMILSPRSDAELECIAHDLLVWAGKDDSVVFDGFVALSGINTGRLYTWAEKNEKLRDSIKLAKRILSARREQRALTGEYSATIVMGMMPLYNDEYKEWKRESQRAAEKASTTERYILVEKMPSSPLVPDKEDAE